MGQTTNFNSNNTENGWIYTYFSEKITKIETDIVELMNTVEQAYSDMKISLSEYQTLVSNINNKCSLDLHNDHIRNNSLHVSSTEKAIWNAKLDPSFIESITINIDEKDNLPCSLNIIMKDDNKKEYSVPININKLK